MLVIVRHGMKNISNVTLVDFDFAFSFHQRFVKDVSDVNMYKYCHGTVNFTWVIHVRTSSLVIFHVHTFVL